MRRHELFQPRPRNLRSARRVAVESLCTEIAGGQEQHSLVVQLSETGLRLQRPFRGRQRSQVVQLEFEIPEVDEICWAQGVICFDQLWPGPTAAGTRTSGVRLVSAAARHLRMLRDYVRAAAPPPRRPSLEPLPLAQLPWR